MVAIAGFAPETTEFYHRGADRAFRQLRAEDPLHWYEPCQFWAVTKYADVQEISQHPRLFSSQRSQLFEQRIPARDQRDLVPGSVERLGDLTADSARCSGDHDVHCRAP